jgi:hypothetical protein
MHDRADQQLFGGGDAAEVGAAGEGVLDAQVTQDRDQPDVGALTELRQGQGHALPAGPAQQGVQGRAVAELSRECR